MKSLMLGAVLAGHEWAEVGECSKSRLSYTALQSSASLPGWNHLYMIERDWAGSWYVNKEHGEYVWKVGDNDKSIRFGPVSGAEMEPTYVCNLSEKMIELSFRKDCFEPLVWERCSPRKQ